MTIANSSPTNAARRRGAKPDADSSSHAGSDQIVVLIRLPHLSSELPAVAQVADQVIQTPLPAALPAEATIPQPPAPTVDASPAETDDGFESLSRPLVASMTKLASGTTQYLTRLRIPKQAWKAGSVVLVLALILVALLSLRGGDRRRSADSDDLAARGLPELQFPEVPPPSLPAVPEVSPNEAPPTEAAAKAAAVPAEQPDKAQPSPEPASAASEPKVPKLEPMVPQDEPADDGDDEPAAPLETTLPLSGPGADDAAPPEPAQAAAEATGRDSVHGDSSAPAEAAATNNVERPLESLTGWPPDGSREDLAQRSYPTTEPATYQYPSRYEQLFVGTPQGPQAESHATSNDQSSIYGWQPNTARLQPRIEPPPIR
jgi:hypothetical protein